MNKSRLTIIDACLCLIILLQVNFFDLITFPPIWDSLNSNVNKYAMLSVSILIWIFSIFTLSKQDSKKVDFRYQQFNMSTLYFFVMLIVVWISSSVIYGQSSLITFQNMYWYFVFPFLYFGLKDYLMDHNSFLKFDRMVVSAGIVVAILYLLYAKSLIVLHPNAVIDIQNLYNGKMQYGFYRFQAPTDFVFFVSFYLSTAVIMGSRTFNLKYVVQQLILIANIFLVGQVRVYFAVAFLLFLFVIFIQIINRLREIKLVPIVVGTVTGLVMIALIINKLGFFGEGTRQASSIVRGEAISYYLSHTFDHVLYGLGFPDIGTNYYLLRGFSQTYQSSVFYLEDVGLFGSIATFGVFGIIYFILLFTKLIRIIKNSDNKIVMSVIIVSLSITFLTLIPLNASRIMLMPFYLIILTSLSRRTNEKHFNGIKL